MERCSHNIKRVYCNNCSSLLCQERAKTEIANTIIAQQQEQIGKLEGWLSEISRICQRTTMPCEVATQAGHVRALNEKYINICEETRNVKKECDETLTKMEKQVVFFRQANEMKILMAKQLADANRRADNYKHIAELALINQTNLSNLMGTMMMERDTALSNFAIKCTKISLAAELLENCAHAPTNGCHCGDRALEALIAPSDGVCIECGDDISALHHTKGAYLGHAYRPV